MRETNVEYIAGEPTLTMYTAEQKHIRVIHEYVNQYPDQVTIVNENPDGSLVVRMPASWFKIPRPPKKMNLTDEQRRALSERLSVARKTQQS